MLAKLPRLNDAMRTKMGNNNYPLAFQDNLRVSRVDSDPAEMASYAIIRSHTEMHSRIARFPITRFLFPDIIVTT